VAGATPCPEMGWPDHPIFGQGVAEPAVWGWPKPPQAFGGGPATPKGQKKKTTKKWVWDFGGGFGHPLRPVGGVPKPLPGPSGWSGHPQRPKPIFPLFFFWPFGVAGPPPKAWGGFGLPLAKNGVVRPPHFWARGGSSHPAIPPFFSFFFFFKKKKAKT
jgi:hypothetical protein